MNECMNEGRLNCRLISMCVCIYVSLLHDSASGGARTALAPCLETWLAPWLAPRYGSRQPTLYLLAMILLLLLVGSLHHVTPVSDAHGTITGSVVTTCACCLPVL